MTVHRFVHRSHASTLHGAFRQDRNLRMSSHGISNVEEVPSYQCSATRGGPGEEFVSSARRDGKAAFTQG